MRRILAAVLALGLTACATIVHGSKQDIGISSSPSGARVTIDGNSIGKTPVVTSLSRGDNHVVKIELEGYADYEGTLTKSTSGWVWGNLALGGLIGLAVDAMTGGLYNLTPEQMQATLATQSNRKPVAANISGGSLMVAVVLAPDPTWQKIGQLESRY